MGLDYRSSGVDRDAADQFIDDLTPRLKATFRPEVESQIGDFGAFFRAPSNLKDPLWVASTDGVGTKLMLAQALNQHRSIGQDLVGMCVNDILACRAEPLVFLDYLATGKLDRQQMSDVLAGIADACRDSNCSLIGGETAEMPGFYAPSKYDLAGFSIGVMERADRLDRSKVAIEDLIFGFASSGFHSNGYSLVRKVVESQKWSWDQIVEGEVLGQALLKPTELYVRKLWPLFSQVQVKALAHITGGGLVENLPRGVPEDRVSLLLQKSQIPTSALMRKFVAVAGLEEREAYSTWNMGIGFCVIASAKDEVLLRQAGGILIGQVVPRAAESVILE